MMSPRLFAPRLFATRLFAIVLVFAGLGGCASGRDVELPSNSGTGADEMKPSPCVCLELEDYDGRGFKWLG